MERPFIIRMASQKGGVGKTVTVVNLATALSRTGNKVLLMDGDANDAGVSIYLGLNPDLPDFKDAIYEGMTVKDVVVKYEAANLDVIPSKGFVGIFAPTNEQVTRFGDQFADLKYDFILTDTVAGFFVPQLDLYYNDALIMTTPDELSIQANLMFTRMLDSLGIKNSLVLNRVSPDKPRIPKEELLTMFGKLPRLELPEDRLVPDSVEAHKPAYLINRGSPFCKGVEKLAEMYLAERSSLKESGNL